MTTATVDKGFRFGTKPSSYPKGGEWVHVYGEHPKYAEIRKNQHRLDTIDNTLQELEKKLEKAADFVRYMRALLIGGHVRRDKLAVCQERAAAKDDPEVVIAGVVDATRTVLQ